MTFKWPPSLGSSYDSASIKDPITGGTLYNVNMVAVDSMVVSNIFITELLIFTYGPKCPSDRVSPNRETPPGGFVLFQNYPNPFNPVSTIRFGIHKAAAVDVAVFDVLGRRVATLASGEFEPGSYTATWNGTGDNGAEASSGVYYVRMLAGGEGGPDHGAFSACRKMLLVK